jgi:hypothetical protein
MPAYDDQLLYKTLAELDVIDSKQLDAAFKQSKEQQTPLETILLSKDLISDANLGRTIADLFSLPFVQLLDTAIPQDVLRVIPEVVAKKQHVIAFKKDDKGLHVAMSDPTNIQVKDFLEKNLVFQLLFIMQQFVIFKTHSFYTPVT